MISTFHKDYLEKPITTSGLIDYTLLIANLMTKPFNVTKKKSGQLAKASIKQTKEV